MRVDRTWMMHGSPSRHTRNREPPVRPRERKTAQDRATCLKEAGAAADERKRNRLDNSGSLPQNAADRCNALTGAERSDCLARVKGASGANQRTTTSGSVAGGGVMKETTTTTTVGSPTIVTLPAPSSASAPGK